MSGWTRTGEGGSQKSSRKGLEQGWEALIAVPVVSALGPGSGCRKKTGAYLVFLLPAFFALVIIVVSP